MSAQLGFSNASRCSCTVKQQCTQVLQGMFHAIVLGAELIGLLCRSCALASQRLRHMDGSIGSHLPHFHPKDIDHSVFPYNQYGSRPGTCEVDVSKQADAHTIPTNSHTHLHTFGHMCRCVSVHMLYVCICTYALMPIHISAFMPGHMSTCPHVYTHAGTHVYVHVHTHAH